MAMTSAPASGFPTRDEWTLAMLRGDFESAWRISDDVLRRRAGRSCGHLPRHQQWIWDGRPLRGRRVLVRCYHGLGDTIQFIRYAAPLHAIAADVTVWAPAPLIPLLATAAGMDRLLPLHDGVPECDADAEVELQELPHAFRTTRSTIPRDVPYLFAPPVPLPVQGRPRVGLVWRAGEWDPRRSVPFEMIVRVAARHDLDAYAMQERPEPGEAHERLTPVGPFDLHGFAGALRSLDLLITVDSMPAHLAGALGVPVWLLLPADADWRWMEERDDSPWYPTMRLFRQDRPGDWEPVLGRVGRALDRIAGRLANPRPSAGVSLRSSDSPGVAVR